MFSDCGEKYFIPVYIQKLFFSLLKIPLKKLPYKEIFMFRHKQIITFELSQNFL